MDKCDEKVVQQTDPVVPVNPYSLPVTHEPDSVEKQQLLIDSNEVAEVLAGGDKIPAAKSDDGVSGSSSVGADSD